MHLQIKKWFKENHRMFISLSVTLIVGLIAYDLYQKGETVLAVTELLILLAFFFRESLARKLALAFGRLRESTTMGVCSVILMLLTLHFLYLGKTSVQDEAPRHFTILLLALSLWTAFAGAVFFVRCLWLMEKREKGYVPTKLPVSEKILALCYAVSATAMIVFLYLACLTADDRYSLYLMGSNISFNPAPVTALIAALVAQVSFLKLLWNHPKKVCATAATV